MTGWLEAEATKFDVTSLSHTISPPFTSSPLFNFLLLFNSPHHSLSSLAINNFWDLRSGSSGSGYMEWVFMAGSIPDRGELLLDLAATLHILSDRLLFTSYTPVTSCTPHDFISVGDARDVPVARHGTVVFEAQLPNGYHKVTLRNVLHVPKLAAHLVSLGTLQRQGASVVSYENGLFLRFNGQEVFCTSLVGTLYHINRCQIQKVSAYVATSESLRLWHQCLGHLNLGAIKDMQQKNMVNSLSILSPQEYDRVCKRCASRQIASPTLSKTEQHCL